MRDFNVPPAEGSLKSGSIKTDFRHQSSVGRGQETRFQNEAEPPRSFSAFLPFEKAFLPAVQMYSTFIGCHRKLNAMPTFDQINGADHARCPLAHTAGPPRAAVVQKSRYLVLILQRKRLSFARRHIGSRNRKGASFGGLRHADSLNAASS